MGSEPTLRLTDPDEDAYAARIWEGLETGMSRQAVEAKLLRQRAALDGLARGTVSPREVVGPGYVNPRQVAEDWLTDQIREGEEALLTHGRSLTVNRRNAAYILMFRRQHAALNTAMDTVPDGYHESSTDPVLLLADGQVVVHGPETAHDACRRAAKAAAALTDADAAQEQAAWLELAHATEPLTRTVAASATLAATHGSDPTAAAAKSATDWLTNAAAPEPRVTVDDTLPDGPRVIVSWKRD